MLTWRNLKQYVEKVVQYVEKVCNRKNHVIVQYVEKALYVKSRAVFHPDLKLELQ